MASIRERLVASNLEIEERNEVIVLLERKLELTKQQLSEVDENVAVDYQRQLRVSLIALQISSFYLY